MEENQQLAEKLFGYGQRIGELKKEIKDLEGTVHCLESDKRNTERALGKLVGKMKRRAVVPISGGKFAVVVSLAPEKDIPEIEIVEVSF